MVDTNISSEFVEVDGVKLHYLDGGSGEPVVFLHGWPTSAYLWRDIVGPIAEHNRILALDLPGFGKSDKPLDASYSFRFFEEMLDGFLGALNIEATSLAVHDLGGPVGLYWASNHPDRLQKLALLNTLVYPKQSWMVMAFVMACKTPGIRAWLSGPRGLRFSMRLGIHDRSHATEEVISAVQEPFPTWEARKALLKDGLQSASERTQTHCRNAAQAQRSCADHLRRARPHSARCVPNDAAGRQGHAASRTHRTPRLRPLPAGRVSGRDLAVAGRLLCR